MSREPLTKGSVLENALREIAFNAAAKDGEWASEQAFAVLEFIEREQLARETDPERDRLKAINAELVAALEALVADIGDTYCAIGNGVAVVSIGQFGRLDRARAVLAKARG